MQWKFDESLVKVSSKPVRSASLSEIFTKLASNLHLKIWKQQKIYHFFWNLTSKQWKNPGKHTENCKMYALKLQNIEEKDIAANIHDMMWNCCTQTARRNVYSNYALKATEVKIIFTKNFLRKSTQKNPKRNVLKNKLEEKSLPKNLRRSVLGGGSSVPRLFWKEISTQISL